MLLSRLNEEFWRRARSTTIFLLVCVFSVFPSFTLAQEDSESGGAPEELSEEVIEREQQQEEEAIIFRAVAGEDRSVAIDRTVLFDASSSFVDGAESVRYVWDFGDGTPQQEGIDVTHTYTEARDFTVRLDVFTRGENGEEIIDSDELVVSVYEDIALLIVDQAVTKKAEIEALKRQAFRQGIFLDTIVHTGGGADYVVEGELVDELLLSREKIAKTNIIIVWAKGSSGVNILTALEPNLTTGEELEDLGLASKGIVVVTDQSLPTIARLAQPAFDSLNPYYILLTQKEALNDVITARTPDNVLNEVQRSEVPNRLVGVYSGRASELSWNNFLSYGVNLMINRGVTVENILLLLMLPIIATLVALSRQVLGLKTFGIYTPSIIALAFVVTGLRLGLIVFLIVLLVATVMRYVLRWLRLAYMPRMAIVLSAVAATIFIVLLAGALTGRSSVILLSIFPVLVLVMLTERFVTAQVEKGLRSAIVLSLQTILVAVAAYALAIWPAFRTFILAYPETILLTLVLNIAAGKWTGLRLTEYVRFRAVRRSTPDVPTVEESSSETVDRSS